ncbi:hypothetical protein ACSFA3_09115 [Variovorax sp. RHLX14]|uniref:hypothetical protein n=1 Tax=Variovorax sp. RHLX14 TaxID=1259731 RepID=UPI003F48DD82
MKLGFAPKYNGLAFALAVAGFTVIAIAAVTWVPRWLPMVLQPREPASSTLDPETIRIERAAENLRQAALFERMQRSGRGEGSDSILTLYSPSTTAAAATESKPFDASTLNVVIVETARGRTATIDGAVVRIGERTSGGGIVRAIDRTGVVIEDGAGAKRSVDIRDKFVGQDAPVVLPTPAKTASSNPAVVK